MKAKNVLTPFSILLLLFQFHCTSNNNSSPTPPPLQSNPKQVVQAKILDYDKNIGTIHIMVALCDNQYQGIVPVPQKLGNGQEPKSNLYWGAAYGIKTYFKRSKEWDLVQTRKVNSTILDRAIFKHKTKEFYIIADAYDGQFIKETTQDFLNSSAGLENDTVIVNNNILGINGNAKLLAYIGHNGLMDFQLHTQFKNQDGIKRDVIILACASKNYFQKHLNQANANPLVWTTNLMAPEAYTIHDAIVGYLNNETNEQIRLRAALAYSNYQKCSLKAAKNLLVTQ